jgi:predicted dithiol-disulfide oxidoreductase (DUF899 family)
MSLPQVASSGEWLIGRQEVLAKESTAARARDTVEARRQRLPMIKLDKGYAFEGPDGKSTLMDLFAGLRRLLVCHFMFDPGGGEGCASCRAAAEEVSDDLLARLRARDTSFVAVSRAPLADIEGYRARTGWAFPWYSSHDSDFNYDFHATRDDRATSLQDNYRAQPGRSVFLRDGSRLFHTYSMFARRSETLGNWCYWLDLTARGRQEYRT